MEKVKIVEQEVKTETSDMVNNSHLDNAMGLPFLSLWEQFMTQTLRLMWPQSAMTMWRSV